MIPELKRVLLSRTAIFTLVALLILDTVFLFSDTKDSIPDDMDHFTYNYVTLVEECKNISESDALPILEAKKQELNTKIAYFSMFGDNESINNGQFVEFFKSVYGEHAFDSLTQESSELSAEEIANFAVELQVYELVYEQVKYVYDEYPSYYSDILQNAERMKNLSLLISPDSFSEKNIKKTVEDFRKIEGVEISLDKDLALTKFFESKLPQYSVLLFVVIISLDMISERRRGLWELVRCTKRGRIHLALWRIAAMLVAATAAVVILLLGQLTVCCACFGGAGDLSRPIQSLSLFKNVPDVQSIALYLVKYFAYKVFGTWIVGLSVWLVLQLVSDVKLAIVVLVCFVSIQYAAFTLIPDSFSIVFLRYINIFSYIDFERIFIKYLNIPLFGSLIRGDRLCYALMPVFILVLCTLCIFVGDKKYPNMRSFANGDRIRSRLNYIYDKLIIRYGLFSYEINKVMVLRLGVLILVVLVAWGIFVAEAPERSAQIDSLDAYCRSLVEGPVNDALFAKIDAELSVIGAIAEPSEYELRRFAAFLNIREQATDLLDQAGGMTPWIVDYSLYAAVFRSDNYESSFIAVLFSALLCSGIFSYENLNRTKHLVRSTKNGKIKLFRAKIAVGLVCTAIVSVFVYSVELALAAEKFGGLRRLNVPLSSLPLGIGFHSEMSVGIWLCRVYLIRLLVMVALTAVCMMISSFCRNPNHALIICVVITVLPYALSFLRIDLLEKLSLIHILSSVAYADYLTTSLSAVFITLISIMLTYLIWIYDSVDLLAILRRQRSL